MFIFVFRCCFCFLLVLPLPYQYEACGFLLVFRERRHAERGALQRYGAGPHATHVYVNSFRRIGNAKESRMGGSGFFFVFSGIIIQHNMYGTANCVAFGQP